jgi:hypothetical protein
MQVSTDFVAASDYILNSWKEIACYLNRGIRTVQRWEADLGMPVHRPRGIGRSAVVAVRCEIDGWIKSCPTEARDAVLPQLEPLRASTLELKRLRTDLGRSRQQLHTAMAGLRATLEKLVASSTATSAKPSNAYAYGRSTVA